MNLTSALLNDAADLIERHGHLKDDYGNPEIGFCAIGALRWASGERQGGDYYAALRYLEIAATGGSSGANVGAEVVDWNDAEERTTEEVVATLRRAAEQVAA